MKILKIETDALKMVAAAMGKTEMFGALKEDSLIKIASRAKLCQYDPRLESVDTFQIPVHPFDHTDHRLLRATGDAFAGIHAQYLRVLRIGQRRDAGPFHQPLPHHT